MKPSIFGSDPARRWDILLLVVLVLFTTAYTVGIVSVPFHPDESTYIFMSSDWESLFRAPTQMAWQPNLSDARQTQRLLDAPLTRYAIGAARWISGYAALPVDWNWSLTFDANQQAGALPDSGLLTASRFGPAAFFPFSLLLIYLTGLKLGGRGLGWLSMLLLATNALVLLHTRRAMAEGGLVFSICLFLACLVYLKKNLWLIAIPTALAFCAKQSTLPLAGIGLLAVLVFALRPLDWPRLLRRVAGYSLLWITIVVVLNPFLWAHPVEAVQAAIATRQALLTRQTQEFTAALPAGSMMNSPLEVGFSMVVNQFLLPPTFSEVDNYKAQTETATQAYLSNPLNSLLRGLLAGGVLFALWIIGFVMSVKHSFSPSTAHRAAWALLGLAGAVQFLALAVTITLPFQRYVLPLIPFGCLWIGYSLMGIVNRLNLPERPLQPAPLLDP